MDTLVKWEIFKIPNAITKEVCDRLVNLPPITHHGDEEGHAVHRKDLCLPEIAKLIWPKVKDLQLDKGVPAYVDPFMKLYKLKAPEGAVTRHTDDDFEDGRKRRALYSVIIYLNDDYEGGATVFNANTESAHHSAGGALIFAHDIPHEGRPVRNGTKYVLKTDIFVD